jgi:hypothetical protein
MSTPCAKYGTTDEVAFMLLSMNMLDIIEDITESPTEELIFLTKLSMGAIANAVSPQDVPRMCQVVTLKLVDALNRSNLSDAEQRQVASKVYGGTWGFIGMPDFSISDAIDPFENPANKIDEPWFNRDSDGRIVQINQKIVEGPDRGIHRYYDIVNNRSGYTGITRDLNGVEYRGIKGERPGKR